jgi:predicted transcriptional regulator
MQPFYTQAQNYVSGLMADGVIDENERREAQTLATQGGRHIPRHVSGGR